MNRVELIGNLVANPEIRNLQNGKRVAKFRIAIKRDFKNPNGEYGSDFINVTSFGSVDAIEKYLYKGRKVAVSGRIQSGSYEKDGQRIYTTEIIADKVEFLGSNNANQQQDQHPQFEPQYEYSDDDIPWN